MSNAEFLPWHAPLHERFVRLHEAERLPHALLLSGPRFVGKRNFALAAAAYLHCREPRDGRHCGACSNCQLLAAGTQPDFRRIFPEERKNGKSTGVMDERKLIIIDQIRAMIEWSGQTAQRGGMKTVVIHPAEQMNQSASNALLKCLEEPADDTVLFLVADLPGRLLPTIRSRCQVFDFRIPDADVGVAWLQAQRSGKSKEELELLLSVGGGAPLSVIEAFDDDYLNRRLEVSSALEQLVSGRNPLDAAKPFAKGDAIQDLLVLESLFADAVRLSVGGSEKFIKNKDMQALLKRLQATISAPGLLQCVELVGRERRAAAGPSNPNVALLFEALFVEIAGMSTL